MPPVRPRRPRLHTCAAEGIQYGLTTDVALVADVHQGETLLVETLSQQMNFEERFSRTPIRVYLMHNRGVFCVYEVYEVQGHYSCWRRVCR